MSAPRILTFYLLTLLIAPWRNFLQLCYHLPRRAIGFIYASLHNMYLQARLKPCTRRYLAHRRRQQIGELRAEVALKEEGMTILKRRVELLQEQIDWLEGRL